MALSRIDVLAGVLTAAGIPFSGLTLPSVPPGQTPVYTPQNVSVNYLPTATAEQIVAGNQIVETFDFRRRRSLTRAQIVNGIQALTTAQQNTVMRHLLAILLREKAAEVAAILSETGLPLAVDEVDPT